MLKLLAATVAATAMVRLVTAWAAPAVVPGAVYSVLMETCGMRWR